MGYLNKKLRDEKINKFEFLNAGVSSYSSYIYQKKIISILDNNPWIKTKMVIVLLDKSDVSDDLLYLDKPEYFSVKKGPKFRFKDKFSDDLKKLYFKSHGSGKIGQIWKRHHEKFYNFLGKQNEE